MQASYRIATLLLTAAFYSTNVRANVTTLVITDTSGVQLYSADPITLNTGTLITGNTLTSGTGGTLTITGGTLTITGGTLTTTGGTLTTTGGTLTTTGGTLTNTGGILTSTSGAYTSTGGLVATNSSYPSISGAYTNTGGLVSINSGSLTLTSTPPDSTAGTTVAGSTIYAPAFVVNSAKTLSQEQVDSISTLIRSGLNFVLFGSHHRILQDNGMTNTGSGFWATGDYAHHNPNSANASVGEFGFYKDFDNVRLGLGAGVAGINQSQQTFPYGSSGKLDSRYALFEIDYRSVASGWTGSSTIYAGDNSATITRYYLSGATPDQSTGDAGGSSWAIRLRGDWNNLSTLADMEVSPYLAYTHAESRLNAYTESGGTLPLAFTGQKLTSDELRGGVTLLSRLSEQTDLRFPLELAHRKNSSATVTAIIAATPISISSDGNKQNWARAGIELDHRLNQQSVLNGAAIFASKGGDATWLTTVSLKHAF